MDIRNFILKNSLINEASQLAFISECLRVNKNYKSVFFKEDNDEFLSIFWENIKENQNINNSSSLNREIIKKRMRNSKKKINIFNVIKNKNLSHQTEKMKKNNNVIQTRNSELMIENNTINNNYLSKRNEFNGNNKKIPINDKLCKIDKFNILKINSVYNEAITNLKLCNRSNFMLIHFPEEYEINNYFEVIYPKKLRLTEFISENSASLEQIPSNIPVANMNIKWKSDVKSSDEVEDIVQTIKRKLPFEAKYCEEKFLELFMKNNYNKASTISDALMNREIF